MRALAVFLLILASCSSSNKVTQSKEYARLHLQLGTSLLTQKNYPGALQEFLDAEKFDPNDAVIQNNLGIAYYVRNDLKNAENHLKRSLELNPKYSDARSNYGRLLLDKKDYSGALEQFTIVSKDLLYPYPEKIRTHLGLAYLEMKKLAAAEQQFVSALEINKKYCPAWTYLGRSLLEQEKFGGAAQRLDHAVDVCKLENFDEPQFYSAIAYLKLGEKEKAVARLEEIVDRDPSGLFYQRSKNLLKTIEGRENTK